MTFGEKIKRLREENKWSQMFVADKLKISVPALSRYESNQCEPKSLKLVVDFALLFNVTTDYLLSNKTEDKQYKKDLFISAYDSDKIDDRDKELLLNLYNNMIKNKKKE